MCTFEICFYKHPILWFKQYFHKRKMMKVFKDKGSK